VIAPLRALLGLTTAPPRRNACAGALLYLTAEEQRGLVCGGVTFASVSKLGEEREMCRVSCEAPLPVGVSLCQRCVGLERTVRDELRRAP
jgi:hypothetical protein